jgi:transposase
MLGCDNAVVEGVDWQEDDDAGDGAGPQLTVIADVRPRRRQAGRCGICGKRRPGYDQGAGRRLWRALDLGPVTAWLEADAPRVSCPEHGVVVAAVPWARHGAAHTRFFDDTVAWLAAACSKTTITALMRVSWRTVGHIIARSRRRNWPPLTRWPGLPGSGSTRSPISAATSTSWWSSTTTAAAWCGPRPAGTPPP